jgi:RHS repeat-associated protein
VDERTSTTTTISGNADTRNYLYAPDGRVIGEYGSSAADVRAEFIWMAPEAANDNGAPFGGDDGLAGYMPLAVAVPAITPGVTDLLWVHANHMGVPAVFTNASGSAIAMPLGYSAPGFPGQSRTLADLYYNKYRDYDPTTGRYIQADPIGLAGGASPYSYAMNSPLRYSDPTGKIPFVIPVPAWSSGVVKKLVKWWSKYDDCPDGSPPPPPVDWCGSHGTEWVPDGNWGIACRNHDGCYGTLGVNKERCDGQLALEIAAECTGNSNFVGLPVCGIIGVAYGGGLIIAGIPYGPSRKAFNDAQRGKR